MQPLRFGWSVQVTPVIVGENPDHAKALETHLTRALAPIKGVIDGVEVKRGVVSLREAQGFGPDDLFVLTPVASDVVELQLKDGRQVDFERKMGQAVPGNPGQIANRVAESVAAFADRIKGQLDKILTA